jgi:hypothetical protein
MSSHELVAALAEHKILSNPVDDSHIRLLTHNDVSREDCLRACEAIGQLVHA